MTEQAGAGPLWRNLVAMRRTTTRLPLIAALLLLASGCTLFRPAAGRAPAPPVEIPLPTEGARADETAEMRQAIAAYSLDNPGPGRAALETFLRKHRKSPHAPTAAALLARLDLHAGDVVAARGWLDRYAPGSNESPVRFVRGVVEARAGQPRRALELLEPFASSGPPPLGAEPDEAELSLRAALADARLGAGDAGGALAEWERYLRHGASREAEKAFARSKVDEIGTRVTEDSALSIYKSTSSELARAAVGARAAAALRAKGDAGGARKVAEDSAGARRSLGFGEAGSAGGLGPGDPHRLGLLAPFSGAAFVLGEVVLRSAMMAIGDSARSGAEAAPLQIVARDSAPEKDAADRRAAYELTREEAAVAIVGVGDRRAVEPALADGLPVLTLDETPPGPASTAFQLLHLPESRAAELARRALALGARRFAILAPDTAGGRRLRTAFAQAVTAGGGRVASEATYTPNTNVFSAPVNQIKRASFEAVFIADDARRLELLAPALAAGDLWPAPWAPTHGRPVSRGPGQPSRREILLLSTAVGASGTILRNAGRYLQGALFAPGFYSDPEDPRSGRFVVQYRTLYGQDPGAADAYAYDAFRMLAAFVDRGARTRSELVAALGSQSYEGVTGAVRFGPDHSRIDPPPIYMVEGDVIRALR
jgi:ABC-type branched-subunit amino acid transport system substrate-binding protein